MNLLISVDTSSRVHDITCGLTSRRSQPALALSVRFAGDGFGSPVAELSTLGVIP